MASNNNGFADALAQTKQLMNLNQQVSKDALKDAAEYFAEKMASRINKSDMNKMNHLKDQLTVVVDGNGVKVVFKKEGWYWHFVNNGHKKRGGKGRVRGQHFLQNTVDAEMQNVERMILEKIEQEMRN